MRYGSNGWSDFIAGTTDCAGVNGCMIDSYRLASNSSIAGAVSACSGAGCLPLRQDNSLQSLAAGFYQYSSGDETGFIRKITFIDTQSTNNEIEVVSEVFWEHGGETSSIRMSEVLTGWVRQIP